MTFLMTDSGSAISSSSRRYFVILLYAHAGTSISILTIFSLVFILFNKEGRPKRGEEEAETSPPQLAPAHDERPKAFVDIVSFLIVTTGRLLHGSPTRWRFEILGNEFKQ